MLADAYGRLPYYMAIPLFPALKKPTSHTLLPMFVRRIRFDDTPRPQRDADNYVWHLPVVAALRRQQVLEVRSPITVVSGDNGSGKSTLLEAIALRLGFPGQGGAIGDSHFLRAWHGDESPLADRLIVKTAAPLLSGWYYRADLHDFAIATMNSPLARGNRNVLSDAADLRARSHGQSLIDLFREHVGRDGVYVLDEPEAGLSVSVQLAASAMIARAASLGSQFFIATHSPIFLGIPGARILELGEEGMCEVAFEESEPVQAMREFLADPKECFRFILED